MAAAALRLVDQLGPDVLDLIPWQEGSIVDICMTDADNQFAASSAGLVVSRQNGKGGVLEVRVVAGVTLPQFGEKRILWTAHTWKTAKDAHERVAAIFLSHPDLKARLLHGDERGIRYGNDSRGIYLRNGAEILFFTRSASAGRGLWADMLICDEALDLTDTELSVLRYTLRTSALRTGRRAQVVYCSTPPDRDKHPNGVVFSRLRQRALQGKARSTLWLEWSPPSLADLSEAAEAEGLRLIGDPRLPDPEAAPPPETVALWAMANPSLGYLFDLGTLLSDRDESDDREFLVEGLAAPDYWPDPDMAASKRAIDPAVWKDRRDPSSRCMDPVVLGIEVSPQRQVSLVAAGWRPDGRIHGEVIAHGPGTGWVLDVLLRTVQKVDPAALVIDKAGEAGSLLPSIQAAGLDPIALNTGQRTQADRGLVDDLEQDALRVVPCTPFDEAAAVATWRDAGDAKALDRRNKQDDISALVGLSVARFGLLTIPRPQTGPVPMPEPIQPAVRTSGREFDLMTAGF